jgi:hypothetical protein
MTGKAQLKDWVHEAVEAHGGSATLIEVARHIWQLHEADLRMSGDLFYTWQYDMRWAAQELRDEGVLKSLEGDRRGRWELA